MPSVRGGLANSQQVRPVFWLPASAVVSLPIRACFGSSAFGPLKISLDIPSQFDRIFLVGLANGVRTTSCTK
jgi:hypothetical protein